MTFTSIHSLFSLEGKVAIVTGAAGYFGRTFAETLLFAGAKVVLYGRGRKIKDIAAFLQDKYEDERVEYCQVDLYDEKEFRNSLVETTAINTTVDILVNNAFDFSKETGFNDPSGKMENISQEQWLRSFTAGVCWPALATQVVGEKMKQQRSGTIINVSSMYAVVAPDPHLYEGTAIFNPPSYGAAKAALTAFTRYTASFLGDFNIRCNALVPGAFPNVSQDSYNSPKDEGFMQRLSKRTVLNRPGEVDDLKGALLLLASDASRYITGQEIIVDGGWTIR